MAKDIKSLADWRDRVELQAYKKQKFYLLENLLAFGSIAKDWASGFSITLDKYAKDLREKIEKTGLKQFATEQSMTPSA